MSSLRDRREERRRQRRALAILVLAIIWGYFIVLGAVILALMYF